MVGESDRHCETLSGKGIGAVKSHRKTVEHNLDQHWSRSQFETHHARWGFRCTDSNAIPDWRRTCHNTHGNRAYSEAEPDQGASIKTKTVWRFRKLWTEDYLLELRNFHEVQRPVGKTVQLRLGDVVLIEDDVRPRHLWWRAHIVELRRGWDGQVRTVMLRTSDGRQITRTIQLVIPLEVDQGGKDVGDFNWKHSLC